MLEGKRIKDYIVSVMIRPTCLTTKYQPVTVQGTTTIPAFVQASWSIRQPKVGVIAGGVQGPAWIWGDDVRVEPVPQEGDVVGLEFSE